MSARLPPAAEPGSDVRRRSGARRRVSVDSAIAATPTASPHGLAATARGRLPRVNARDLVVAAAAAAPTVLLIAFGGATRAADQNRLGAVVISVLAAAPLVFRRRAPLATLVAVVVVGVIARDRWEITLPALIAVFNAALRHPRRTTILVAATTALVLSLSALVHDQPLRPGDALSRTLSVAVAAAVGLYLAARRDYVEQLHDRADQLEHEQELVAKRAVAEERLQIARELHDVVAHTVSLILVQAQALEGTAASCPEADATLRSIAAAGRDALAEMQRMLGVLRVDTSGADGRAPQPGLDQIAAIVEQARTAGVDTTFEIDGVREALPAAVELTAFRIVQEALTNVRKHARAAHAWVCLSYEPRLLRIEVRDDGTASVPSQAGHGLIGMQERVALFGGTLSAGPEPGGGFAVRTEIPTGAAP
jgi:signal transduction histidine kinase